MNVHHYPRGFLLALLMLALAVFMAALPQGPAYAGEPSARAAAEQAAPEGKGFVQSVNELLGVKPSGGQARS